MASKDSLVCVVEEDDLTGSLFKWATHEKNDNIQDGNK